MFMNLTREEAKSCVGKGWHKLLDTLYNSMPEDVTVQQVKEKFGTLRFYYSGGDKIFDAIVSLTETVSGVVCEVCGKNGENKVRLGWYRTLCEECEKKEQELD
jgi:hypothetical protein